SGVELLTMMLDQDPAGDELTTVIDEWEPDSVPTDGEMIMRGATGLIRKPGRAILLTASTAREVGRATRNPVMVAAANQVRGSLRGPVGAVWNVGRDRSPEVDAVGPLPSFSPPRTPFNNTITAHRRFAFRSAKLSTVKAVKNALGATVNDVVMAVCAGGL